LNVDEIEPSERRREKGRGKIRGRNSMMIVKVRETSE